MGQIAMRNGVHDEKRNPEPTPTRRSLATPQAKPREAAPETLRTTGKLLALPAAPHSLA